MERNETQTRSVKHGDCLPCQKSAFREKVWKTDTDGWTDRRTECKPIVPFGFAGRGLRKVKFDTSFRYLQIFNIFILTFWLQKKNHLSL